MHTFESIAKRAAPWQPMPRSGKNPSVRQASAEAAGE